MTSVSDVRFTAAGQSEQRDGLVGHLSFVLDDALRVDGVMLRRTMTGNFTLSWPCRTDRRGTRHPYLRPLNTKTRRELEHAILTAIRVDPDHREGSDHA